MMKSNIIKVLLLGGGTQSLIMAEKLYKDGYKVYSLCHDKWDYGYHTKYTHAVLGPSLKAHSEYKEFLVNFISEKKIDVLIPMGDTVAHFLSLEKKDLLPIVHYIMPDIDVFNMGYDKQSLMSICAANNLPHPKTIDLAKEEHRACSFLYPALIKPNLTTGARGMTLVNSYEEFKKVYQGIRTNYGPCHLQEFIPAGGGQIEVQVFIGDDGSLKASSVIYKYRFYPEKGGSSSCNITIKNDRLVNLCYKLAKLIGWVGLADFDMIEDPRDGVVKFMELNPRVPACVKSAILSGPNYASIIVNASLGLPFKEYEYKPGFKLRHLGFELLWFLQSKNRFKTKPNWFNFFSKNLYYQDFSWRDPMPFIFGTIGNIKKFMNPNFRKSKSGVR